MTIVFTCPSRRDTEVFSSKNPSDEMVRLWLPGSSEMVFPELPTKIPLSKTVARLTLVSRITPVMGFEAAMGGVGVRGVFPATFLGADERDFRDS